MEAAEPDADEGESIPWMASAEMHLTDPTAAAPVEPIVSGPLPVCDYTGEDDEPCEEPAQERRWSSTAVITSAAFGALVGGLLVAAVLIWALGLIPGVRPLNDIAGGQERRPSADTSLTIAPGSGISDVSEVVARKVVPSVVNVTVGRRA